MLYTFLQVQQVSMVLEAATMEQKVQEYYKASQNAADGSPLDSDMAFALCAFSLPMGFYFKKRNNLI